MNDRERLIDILYKGFYISPENDIKGTVQKAADYLIAHGVTVQKHGRWHFKWDAERDPRRLFVRIVCSECNLHTGQKSNYCPNCGAKMDGEA